MPPGAVDFGLGALRAEHQVGIQPQQAVAPAHFAALDRFQQEIPAARFDQLDRRADRSLGIGDEPLPDQRRAPVGQRRQCSFAVVQARHALLVSCRRRGGS